MALTHRSSRFQDESLDPVAIRANIGNRAFTASLDVWISQMLQEHPSQGWVTQVVIKMVEMLGSAMDRGYFNGQVGRVASLNDKIFTIMLFCRLLFAVRAAAEIAFDTDARRHVSTLFDRIDKSYRSETAIARKTTMEMWKVVEDGTGDEQGLDFERFLRRNGCYVPAF